MFKPANKNKGPEKYKVHAKHPAIGRKQTESSNMSCVKHCISVAVAAQLHWNCCFPVMILHKPANGGEIPTNYSSQRKSQIPMKDTPSST